MKSLEWINVMLDQLSVLKDHNGADLLHKCGEECSKGSLLLEGAMEIRKLLKNEDDLDKLFNAYKSKYYNTPRLTKEGDRIILVFDECTCPLVREGVRNSYLCHCTVGYTKKIFETLFGRAVSVELKQSILQGDEVCQQIIGIS